MAADVGKQPWEIGDIVDVLEAVENRRAAAWNQADTPENEEAVRDLRRTAFSSQAAAEEQAGDWSRDAAFKEVEMSGYGPERLFAATPQYVRSRD